MKKENNIDSRLRPLNDAPTKSVEIASEFTKKDIERSFNIETVKGTEAYYSNRYGWCLRKSLD